MNKIHSVLDGDVYYEENNVANFCFRVRAELMAGHHPCWRKLECHIKHTDHPGDTEQ